MKTRSTPATIATRRPWSAPVLLLQIEFTSPAAFTLRCSDQYRIALDQQWLPLVKDWGTLAAALNIVDLGGKPATATVTFTNALPIEGTGKARLSDLIRTPLNTSGTYEWAFAKVTVTQLLDESHDSGDELPLGVFYLEDPSDIDERTLTVSMSDLSLVLEDKLQVTRVTKALFPNADPDAVGREIPVPFGVLTNVPVLAVVAGAQSTLSAAVPVGTPVATLSVTDTAAFPDAGTVQVDDEQLTYNGKTPTTLSITARGASGTTATAHSSGAAIWEVRSGAKAYRYVVGENRGAYRIRSVTKVQANGVLQPAATIDLADTTLVPGRSFAVINFPALPVVKRQVALAVADALSVSDNIGLVTTSRTTTTSPGTPDTVQSSSGSVQATNTPASASAVITKPGSQSGSASASIPISVPSAPVGGINNVNRAITFRITEFSIASTQWSIRRADGTILMQGSSFPALGSYTFQWSTGGAYGGDTINFGVTGFGPGRFTVVVDTYQLNVNGSVTIAGTGGSTVMTEVTATKTGSAFRQGSVGLGGNSTADVVIGDVTCDVEGLQDDSAGTISGTPYLLLENPHDVAKAILLACYPGVSAADLGATWATTRAALASFGYRWAALLGYDTFSNLRKRLGDQARSVLYLESGQLEFKFLEDAPATVLTLDYDRDLWAGAPAKISRTPRTEVKNSLWAYSQRDYTRTGALADQYARAKNLKDLRTFPDEVQEDLELDLIQSAATADAVASFHLVQKKRQRLIVDFIAWWNVAGLEQADYIAVTNHPILAAYGGSALVFRVVARQYLLGADNPGRIALKLLEVAGQTSAEDSGLPNVVITTDEVGRGLNGTRTQLVRVTSTASGLPQLSDLNPFWFDLMGGRWFDDAELAAMWFRTTGARIYESEPVDKGRPGPSLIAITLPATIVETVAWFSDLGTDWFPDRPLDWFDRFGDDTAVLIVEVNRSDDNVTYAGWEAWVAGQSYSFRYVKVRASLTPSSPTAALTVDTFLIELDVPDLVVDITEVAIGAGGSVLTFADFGASFVIVPEVKVVPTGLSAGVTVTVKNVTLTDCRIELRDEHNVLVSGLADVTLAAY